MLEWVYRIKFGHEKRELVIINTSIIFSLDLFIVSFTAFTPAM